MAHTGFSGQFTLVVLQLIHPQGSTRPALAYGMLATFLAVALAYCVAFLVATFVRPRA